MHGADFNPVNPTFIRAAIIVLFLVITTFLRARQLSKTPKPVSRPGNAPSLDAVREAMRQASETAQRRRNETLLREEHPVPDGEPLKLNEAFKQPPTIQPESSFLPSLLLLALLVCLCLMAYRYWVG
jgi:hypothetical protein